MPGTRNISESVVVANVVYGATNATSNVDGCSEQASPGQVRRVFCILMSWIVRFPTGIDVWLSGSITPTSFFVLCSAGCSSCRCSDINSHAWNPGRWLRSTVSRSYLRSRGLPLDRVFHDTTSSRVCLASFPRYPSPQLQVGVQPKYEHTVDPVDPSGTPLF